jgi:hypothetical protein
MIAENIRFLDAPANCVAYTINGSASCDEWKEIFVIHNGNAQTISYVLDGEWTVACENGKIDINGIRKVADTIEVPATSASVLFRQ